MFLILYLNRKNLKPRTMKPLLFVATLSCFFFTSCKKDYVCECTTSSPGGTTTSTSNIPKSTKKDAENTCKQNSGSSFIYNQQVTIDCKLK